MSTIHDHLIRCSMCFNEFDVRRAKPTMSARRLKTHDIYPCPQCGYLVAIPHQTPILV